jgi:hypothetical protein
MDTSPNGPVRHEVVELVKLRPTQITVGMLEVQHKRRRLRALEKRPAELINFILEMPIRVVMGPAGKAYVIDHHHLGLALLEENFESAPMLVEADFSRLRLAAFWKRMRARKWVHPITAKGGAKPLSRLPKDLKCLKDDPYRSLAGFVRSRGGFHKTEAPFAEFIWADFFRQHIGAKAMRKDFEKCVNKAVKLARSEKARKLPGYLGEVGGQRAPRGQGASGTR